MTEKNKLILPNLENCNVSVIGLGYVGLPLAVQISKIKKCFFSTKKINRKVVGIDLNSKRINELNLGIDSTFEIDNSDIKYLKTIFFSKNYESALNSDVFIITVPTPINSQKEPDLSFIVKATESVGEIIKKRDSKSKPIIIYESTVFPGTTEEICVPILEKNSSLKYNIDFFCGYSPERINPGDKTRRLSSIIKVTSGSNKIVSEWIDSFYSSIIKAGTHRAKSIKIAETAKVIENTQRDLNIALVNELAKIFKKLEVDTHDVLEAAGSKWNFLPFRPGLVGGHCISVDPYYLTYKSKLLGYNPEVVLAGRKVNDEMGEWIVTEILKEVKRKNIEQRKCKFLILGITFKENCPDTRNSKVQDIIKFLNRKNIVPFIYDPYVDNSESLDTSLEFNLIDRFEKISQNYDVVIVAVAHKQFKSFTDEEWSRLTKKDGIIYDVKGLVPITMKPMRL